MRLLVFLILALAGCAPGAAPSPPLAAEPWQRQMSERLGRGLNVLGYDPLWRDPAKARFQDRHFAEIRQAGFRTLRVNLQAFTHMDPSGALEPRWLDSLDRVVGRATAEGLVVILDEHDFRPCGLDAVACQPRLLAFWRQIAERYRNAPDTVLFELLNEPNRQLTDALWNRNLAELLAVVRQSNPMRTVVIGPASSNSIRSLDKLELPEADRNILVTVHYYDPFRFTHQGAAWVQNGPLPTGVSWGSAADRAQLDAAFDGVARWSKAHQRPIFLGEFGAYDKAEMADRAAYTAAVARAAEARGWPWAYWQFDSDFVAYDMKAQAWVEPIRKALIP